MASRVVVSGDTLYEDLDSTQWWLKPNMDRKGAEGFLKTPGFPAGVFIVRETTKNPGCTYVLSHLGASGAVSHALIHNIGNTGRITLDNTRSFPSVGDLIAYHQACPLNGLCLVAVDPSTISSSGGANTVYGEDDEVYDAMGAAKVDSDYAVVSDAPVVTRAVQPAQPPRRSQPALPTAAPAHELYGNVPAPAPAPAPAAAPVAHKPDLYENVPAPAAAVVVPRTEPRYGNTDDGPARPPTLYRSSAALEAAAAQYGGKVVASGEGVYGPKPRGPVVAAMAEHLYDVQIIPGSEGKAAEVEYEIEEEYDTGAGSFDAEAFAMSFSSMFKRPTLE